MAGAAAVLMRASEGRAGERGTVVRVRNGLVRGCQNDGIRAFTGIPYAQAPVGPLRFRPPRPVRPWVGELDATGPARVPPQDTDPALPQTGLMSEDCLQLNVWAPEEPASHPVFVWVYGGGNVTGSVSLPVYDGATFARDGAVCVSGNYRLGALGFLELGTITGSKDEGSSLNALRDLILVLEWVRDNIAAFGGDPNRITLAGQSAGAWNCATLMAMPAARGLFHQSILASGGADTVYTPERAHEFAREFVARLGGKERLRVCSVQELLTAQREAQADASTLIAFRPMIDGRELPASPIESLQRGCARSITTMIGHTRDELRYFFSPANAEGSGSQKALMHLNSSTRSAMSSTYERIYPELTPGERMLRTLSADVIGIPSLRIAEAQTRAGGTVYRYELHYTIPNGPFGTFSPHGIDVPLIFERVDTAFAHTVFGYSGVDLPMAEQHHANWISFIKTGVPGAHLSPWPAFALFDRRTMMIGDNCTVASDPDQAERMAWESVI